MTTDSAGGASLKQLDVGNGRLVASLGATRPELLSVMCYEREHGVAELSALPPFDEQARGDAERVRRYRQLIASDDHPCLALETRAGDATLGDRVDTADPERPQWHGRIGGAALRAQAWADGDGITLAWEVAHPGDELRLIFGGRLDRPALAEITELDPPRPTGAVTTLDARGPRLLVRSTLAAAIALDVGAGEWLVDGTTATLELGRAVTVTVRITAADDASRGRPRATGTGRARPGPGSRIVERAVAYTRGCAAINTAPDEVAILADHRLLPLSWTRDAYYQALLMLATGLPADAELVADHLRWLWRRCERPAGRWLRSHHANGRPKDFAFQADQQLYPMIELADYWRATGALPAGVDWSAAVDAAWAATIAARDPASGLVATAETAADDPVSAPFVAGSQILLWYTALRLAELADSGLIDLDTVEMRTLAAAVKQAFERHFVWGDRWLYATDTRDMHVDYHDANDLPVALAALLGFCTAEDALWRGTMKFAYSDANPGYFAGERGGLGSAHTPAPWALGDVQAWICARTVGDEVGLAAAIERLAEVAFEDGMLPEAYSAARDPDVRIRHWFAWPGAAYAALVLLDERGELERRLRPRA